MSEHVKHGVMMFPRATWVCGSCGKANPGDLGFCPRCKGGTLERGGLLNGEKPYFPEFHYKQAGFTNI